MQEKRRMQKIRNVFLFAALVEGLQAVNIVELLGLQDNRFFSVLIGTTFDWKDIACYGVGCVLLGVWEVVLWKKEKCSKENNKEK